MSLVHSFFLSLNMSSRNPFPPARYENDFTLSGFRPQRKAFKKPCHIAQREEPWSHLHDTATLASTQRSVMNDEPQPQATNDSLDFLLKSIYNHHNDLFCSRNQVSHQKETVSADHRERENLEKQDMLKKEGDNDIIRWVEPKRSSIHKTE